MLRIRLTRRGKKKQPHYRVVVADARFKRDGRFVENIGFYNPLTNPSTVNIKEDRALYWLSVGAQPSDAVRRFLEKQGTYERLKRLHQGESIEALIAEYEGTSGEEAAAKKESKAKKQPAKKEEAEPASPAAEVVETVQETIAETAAAVEETIETAVEEVSDVAADVVETVGEAAEAAAEAVTGGEETEEKEEEEKQEEGASSG